MNELRLGILGVGGRMGRALVSAIAATQGTKITVGIERAGSALFGQDVGSLAGVGPLGVVIGDDIRALAAQADVILDFTTPATTVAVAQLAADARVAHVIGTTGLTAEDEAAIRRAATSTVVVKSGNMSLGVNLLAAITERVAAALDEDFDIEILEMHHRMKVDAPSGTALLLGEAAARGRKISLADRAMRARDGHTGARRRGDIGFQALRGGDVVGEHTVIFAAEGERIEIVHKATDRGLFARGALKAALWTRGKDPGLYTMANVLGL